MEKQKSELLVLSNSNVELLPEIIYKPFDDQDKIEKLEARHKERQEQLVSAYDTYGEIDLLFVYEHAALGQLLFGGCIETEQFIELMSQAPTLQIDKLEEAIMMVNGYVKEGGLSRQIHEFRLAA